MWVCRFCGKEGNHRVDLVFPKGVIFCHVCDEHLAAIKQSGVFRCTRCGDMEIGKSNKPCQTCGGSE
jgi:predicted RNA-binding Zn-ribbon protein involved in translation (DUF1610 family)